MRLSIRFGALLALIVVAGCQTVQPPTTADTPVCGDAVSGLRQLARDYGELPVGMGAAADGTVFILTLSPSGTWTALSGQPDGTICGISAGDTWTVVEPPDPST